MFIPLATVQEPGNIRGLYPMWFEWEEQLQEPQGPPPNANLLACVHLQALELYFTRDNVLVLHEWGIHLN